MKPSQLRCKFIGWWLQRPNLWLARRPWKATLLTKMHIYVISCLTPLGKTIPRSKTSVIREAFSRAHRRVYPRVLCVHECYFIKRGTMPTNRIFTREVFFYPCQVSSTILEMTSNQIYIFDLLQDCVNIRWLHVETSNTMCIEAVLLQLCYWWKYNGTVIGKTVE